MNIKRINCEDTNIVIKELKNFDKRFPPEFYNIYSHNKNFSEKKIYKIIAKSTDITKKYNIILIKDINEITNETIMDILEDYKNKEIIFIDDYGLEHDNFFNIFNGLDNIYFNWNKNSFHYKNKKPGSHYKNNYKKSKLIY